MEHQAKIRLPICEISLNFVDEYLMGISFLEDINKQKGKMPPFVRVVKNQLGQYFRDARFKFTLPIKIYGTDLQKKVWYELTKIPVGKTVSYGELAKKLKTSPRVIGNACRANPLPIIIPCHRVIGKTGLTGYAGKRSGRFLTIKQQLLVHESLFENRN